jgi:hypothetical protein
MEGLPSDPGGIGDPVFIGFRVAAGLLALLHHARIGFFQLRSHPAQLLIGFHLET